MQDCKDWSALQFMKFDLLTSIQKIKLTILTCVILTFVCLVHISLPPSLLVMVSSNLKIIK